MRQIGRTARIADRAIPKPSGARTVHHKGGATIENIMDAVIFTHQEYIGQTKEFARYFDFTNYNDFKKLWKICRDAIKYKIDNPGLEIVKAPSYLWKVRNAEGGDCKSKTVFSGTTMMNAGVPVVYRLCHFGDKSKSHVFPVAITEGGEIIMDSVHTQFDQEPPGIKYSIDYDPNTGKMFNQVGSLNDAPDYIKWILIGAGAFITYRLLRA